MNQLNQLLQQRITRKQFPLAFGLSLGAVFGLIRMALRAADEESTPAQEPQSPRPNYGAWRPRSAGSSKSTTV